MTVNYDDPTLTYDLATVAYDGPSARQHGRGRRTQPQTPQRWRSDVDLWRLSARWRVVDPEIETGGTLQAAAAPVPAQATFGWACSSAAPVNFAYDAPKLPELPPLP